MLLKWSNRFSSPKNKQSDGSLALQSGPPAAAAVLLLSLCGLWLSPARPHWLFVINPLITAYVVQYPYQLEKQHRFFQEALWRGPTCHVKSPSANMLWYGMISKKLVISLECVLETWGVLDGIWHPICLEVNILMMSSLALPFYNYKPRILSCLKEIKLFSNQLLQSDAWHMGNG